MERQWVLGEDILPGDSLLDGISFDDVILALHQERTISEESAKKVLDDILENRLADMRFLFEKNLAEIIGRAAEGRE